MNRITRGYYQQAIAALPQIPEGRIFCVSELFSRPEWLQIPDEYRKSLGRVFFNRHVKQNLIPRGYAVGGQTNSLVYHYEKTSFM